VTSLSKREILIHGFSFSLFCVKRKSSKQKSGATTITTTTIHIMTLNIIGSIATLTVMLC
jgi:hypothetical protein